MGLDRDAKGRECLREKSESVRFFLGRVSRHENSKIWNEVPNIRVKLVSLIYEVKTMGRNCNFIEKLVYHREAW